MEVAEALQAFGIQGAIDSVAPFGSGHINDSFLVKQEGKQYLLQRLNSSIFQFPERIEKNLQLLLSTNSNLFVEHFMTESGAYHWGNNQGYWRLMAFCVDVYAPTKITTAKEVTEAGKAFGQFLALSSTLDVRQFEEVIPGFHHLQLRLAQFDEVKNRASDDRLAHAKECVRMLNEFRWVEGEFDELRKGLNIRVCHNDTKLDNLLFSKEHSECRFVIDLDTVGPGYALYDFGDMMRTMLSPTAENEPDESSINFHVNLLESLKGTYLAETGHFLSPEEKESLDFGGLYMTYIMGVRFLTDFLAGDRYYRVSHEKENLIRARNQFRLLALMTEALNYGR